MESTLESFKAFYKYLIFYMCGVTMWDLQMPCIPFLSLTLNTSNWKLMIQRNRTSQHHAILDLLNPWNHIFSLVKMPIIISQNCTLKYEVPHKNQGKLDSTQDCSLPPQHVFSQFRFSAFSSQVWYPISYLKWDLIPINL